MRCTLAKIPESNSLLQKSRLPLGILIHPFRDINVSVFVRIISITILIICILPDSRAYQLYNVRI